MEKVGKELVVDGGKGLTFTNLNLTRQALRSYPGVLSEETYMKYNEETNEMKVYADIVTEKRKDFDKAACLKRLAEDLPANNVPLDLNLL
jgi:hypothetical protein